MNNLYSFNLNKRTTAELSSAVALRKLPHAIAVCFGEESMRLDLARYISGAYLCSSNDKRPCGECNSCRKIFSDIHPDVQFFSREKDKKEFSVKIIRDFIRPNAFVKPNEADGKVFIIKDGETLNQNAQNALLKILEEPPKGVMFIILSDDLSSLLETIRSRCTVYSLADNQQNDFQLDKAANIAKSLALSLLSHNEFEFMSQTGIFEKDKELLSFVLKIMQTIFRDALALKSGSILINEDIETSNRLASSLSTSNLIKLVEKTDELSQAININANHTLLLTRFSSVLRQCAKE